METQRSMKRSMLGITLRDEIPTEAIRTRTKVTDAIEKITNPKWSRDGHVEGFLTLHEKEDW